MQKARYFGGAIFRKVLKTKHLPKCLPSVQKWSFSSSSSELAQKMQAYTDLTNRNQQAFMNELDQVLKTKGKKKLLRGRLMVCPTPLGNVKDMSIRQYEALLDCDIIACEDPKVTGELFKALKDKDLRGKFYEKFEITLDEVKDTIDGVEIQEEEDFFDELEQPSAVTESKTAFPEVDAVSFKYNPELIYDESLFDVEDRFMYMLQKKIKDLKENKGRGLLIGYYRKNQSLRISKLIKCLQYNFKVALVANTGTPTVFDPGYEFISEAHKENILVESLPGPSELSVALSLSGFPSDRFMFKKYLPKDPEEKTKELENLRDSGLTFAVFEDKEKLIRTLKLIEKLYGEGQLVWVGSNLTRITQSIMRGKVQEICEKIVNDEESLKEHKKEVILIVAPHSAAYNKQLQDQMGAEKVEYNQQEYEIHVDQIINVLREKLEAGDKTIASLLADILQIPKKKAMKYIQRKSDE